MDLTTRMLQQLKDQKAALDETIAALDHLARRQAKGGLSSEHEVARTHSVIVSAMSNEERRPSQRGKRPAQARSA